MIGNNVECCKSQLIIMYTHYCAHLNNGFRLLSQRVTVLQGIGIMTHTFTSSCNIPPRLDTFNMGPLSCSTLWQSSFWSLWGHVGHNLVKSFWSCLPKYNKAWLVKNVMTEDNQKGKSIKSLHLGDHSPTDNKMKFDKIGIGPWCYLLSLTMTSFNCAKGFNLPSV